MKEHNNQIEEHNNDEINLNHNENSNNDYNNKNNQNYLNNILNPNLRIIIPKKNKNINKKNIPITNLNNEGRIDINNDNNISSNHINENSSRNNNKNLCKFCKNNLQANNNENNICENCFKVIIFNQFCQNIQDGNYSINGNNKICNLIEKYNYNFNKKLNRDLFNKHITNKECIFYEDCSKDNRVKLPCGCYLCFHLIKFFKNFEFRNRFICQCSKVYNRVNMIKLGVLLFDKIKISKKISKYFQERAANKCCFCEKIFVNKNHVKLAIFKCPNYKDLNLNEDALNNFLSSFNHHFCNDCEKKVLNEFKCKICEIEHLIDKSKSNITKMIK